MSPKYYLPDGSTPTYEAIQQRPWMETVLPLTLDDVKMLLITDLVSAIWQKGAPLVEQERLLERALQEPTIGDAIDFVNRSNC
jgi:hypothetical protein